MPLFTHKPIAKELHDTNSKKSFKLDGAWQSACRIMVVISNCAQAILSNSQYIRICGYLYARASQLGYFLLKYASPPDLVRELSNTQYGTRELSIGIPNGQAIIGTLPFLHRIVAIPYSIPFIRGWLISGHSSIQRLKY